MIAVRAVCSRVVLAAAVLTALGACQPVDSPRPAGVTPSASVSEPLGAPEADADSFAEALERAHQAAREWQDEPRLAAVEIDLPRGAVTTSRFTYVAGDAIRMLVVEVRRDGLDQQQPTLATLGVVPVTEDAVAQIPDLPDAVRDPLALLEAAARCGAPRPRLLLLETGAPYAWDGSTWSESPEWRASAVTGTGDDAPVTRLELDADGAPDCA